MIAVSLSFPYEDTMVSRRGNGRFSTGILAFLYEETVVSLLAYLSPFMGALSFPQRSIAVTAKYFLAFQGWMGA